MAVKWKSTNFSGVRYYEHPTKKNGIQKDRYFAIRYQLNGKRYEEGIGWASEGWTAEDAFYERKKIRNAHRKGESVKTLQEKREEAEQQKIKEQQEKERREKENIPFKTFFTETYVPISKTTKRSESWRKEEELFNNWIKPVIGDKPFQEISPFDIEKIKKNMLDAGRAPRTVQYCFAVIRQTWNTARRKGLINAESPTKQVKIPKIDNERQRFLTRDEAKRLLENIKGRSTQLYQMSMLALYCGLRASEIFNLTWGDVDTERGFFRLNKTKTGTTQYTFMPDNIKQMFEGMDRGLQQELVFKDRKGRKIKSVSNAFDRAVEKVGLNKHATNGKDRVVFHSLRHTYASWLVESGVDLYTVQKLMRHGNFKMTERYAHLGDSTLQAAVRRLDRPEEQQKAEVVNIGQGGE